MTHAASHRHVRAPDGVSLHLETRGSGGPVTVFAAGLGGTIAETRTLASGVSGTRVFFDFRGHGGSGSPAGDDWSYAALSADLRAVADATAATRAVGVSMGAAALMGVLAGTPDRFERNVFFLPAILDAPRHDVVTSRLGRVAHRIEEGDTSAVAELLLAEVPRELRDRPETVTYVRERAARLSAGAVAGLVRALAETRPVADRTALASVGAPCLVVGQEGDDVHPAQVARELAATLPNARLHVFGTPGGLWVHRSELRRLITAFLLKTPGAQRLRPRQSPTVTALRIGLGLGFVVAAQVGPIWMCRATTLRAARRAACRGRRCGHRRPRVRRARRGRRDAVPGCAVLRTALGVPAWRCYRRGCSRPRRLTVRPNGATHPGPPALPDEGRARRTDRWPVVTCAPNVTSGRNVYSPRGLSDSSVGKTGRVPPSRAHPEGPLHMLGRSSACP